MSRYWITYLGSDEEAAHSFDGTLIEAIEEASNMVNDPESGGEPPPYRTDHGFLTGILIKLDQPANDLKPSPPLSSLESEELIRRLEQCGSMGEVMIRLFQVLGSPKRGAITYL